MQLRSLRSPSFALALLALAACAAPSDVDPIDRSPAGVGRRLPSGPGLFASHLSSVDWLTIPAHWRGVPVEAFGTSRQVRVVPNPFVSKGRVALRLEGLLEVSAAEVYRFGLASSDGSRLWIDGRLVVDNDGVHEAREIEGSCELTPGFHPITVVWFGDRQRGSLRLRWGRSGEELTEVPASALHH